MAVDRIHILAYESNDIMNDTHINLNDKFIAVLKEFSYKWVPLRSVSRLLAHSADANQQTRAIVCDKRTILMQDSNYTRFARAFITNMYFQYNDVEAMYRTMQIPLVLNTDRMALTMIHRHKQAMDGLGVMQRMYNQMILQAERHFIEDEVISMVDETPVATNTYTIQAAHMSSSDSR